MPQYRLFEVSGVSVVQEHGVAVHRFHQTDTPKGRRAPLGARCLPIGAVIGQALAHVVQEQVGVREDYLAAAVGFGSDAHAEKDRMNMNIKAKARTVFFPMIPLSVVFFQVS